MTQGVVVGIVLNAGQVQQNTTQYNVYLVLIFFAFLMPLCVFGGGTVVKAFKQKAEAEAEEVSRRERAEKHEDEVDKEEKLRRQKLSSSTVQDDFFARDLNDSPLSLMPMVASTRDPAETSSLLMGGADTTHAAPQHVSSAACPSRMLAHLASSPEAKNEAQAAQTPDRTRKALEVPHKYLSTVDRAQAAIAAEKARSFPDKLPPPLSSSPARAPKEDRSARDLKDPPPLSFKPMIT